MRKFVKNRPLLLTTVGLLIMAQSIFWEYVRVEPTYRFVIEPWSRRGFELTQGWVIAISAIVLAAVAILLSYGIIKETLTHSAITVGALVAYGVIVAIVADANDVKMSLVVHLILAAIGAVAIRVLAQEALPGGLTGATRRLANLGIWLAAFFVLLFGVIRPLLKDTHPLWIFMLIAGILLGVLVLLRQPRQLAGWRIVINGLVAIWVMSMTMAASLRITLQQLQFEQNGVSAEVLDLQITSGVILAWLGGLIAFTGAVGMWAKRRDEIIAYERARKQQEAARESERQLAQTG